MLIPRLVILARLNANNRLLLNEKLNSALGSTPDITRNAHVTRLVGWSYALWVGLVDNKRQFWLEIVTLLSNTRVCTLKY